MLSDERKEVILEKLAFFGALKSVGKAMWGAAKASKYSPAKAWGQAKGLGRAFGTSKGRAGIAKKWGAMDDAGRQKFVGGLARKAALPAAYGAAGLYGAKKLFGGNNNQPQVNVYS